MSFSDYFPLEELIASDYATRHNIDNTPSADVLANLKVLSAGLNRVRSILGCPMRVNSGYRSPKLNSALRGSSKSAHMRGLAADFVAPAFGTPLEICQMIHGHADTIGFTQLIHEGGKWVHIAFPDVDEQPKHEVLTAHFSPNGVTYTKGLA